MRLFRLLLPPITFLATTVAALSAGERVLVNLNAGWRFALGDVPRATEPGLDDQAWQAIELPHTWNGLDGEDGGNDYHRGPGWYRRHFTPDASLAGKRLYLQFDGACLMADVYVNGVHLGNHKGGFARFRLDATDALHPGVDNEISVRVDNGKLGIPPTDSDFTICGGLYRSVWLLATDPVGAHVHRRHLDGVFVEQHAVSAESASFVVRAELENHGGAP
ncbi:MAG TPA: sugar-binding domain-containing protein, partial [Opitutaceae bacterium]